MSELCPKCCEEFDNGERVPTVFPCTQGHLICKQCVESMKENSTANYKQCAMGGEYCDENLTHLRCHVCFEVNHLPREGVNKLITIPVEGEYLDTIRKDLMRKKKALRDKEMEMCSTIEEVADILNEHHRNCNISRTTGTAAGIAGGVMIAAGIALIPVTLGVSTGLSLAGATLSAAGGIVGSVSSVVELLIGRDKKNKIEADIQETNRLKIELRNSLRLYSTGCRLAECITKSIDQFPIISNSNIGNIVVSSTRTAYATSNIVRCAMTAQILAADTARVVTGIAKGVQLGTGAATAALLPLDIVFLVMFAREIHRNTPSELSVKLMEMIEQIKKDDAAFLDGIENEVREADKTRRQAFKK